MIDKQILIFEMTSKCNSLCEDCLRMGMNHEDYSLTYNEVKKALKEVNTFAKNFKNFELKISGGEPTIWSDNKYTILDVIELINNYYLNYSLITNGKVFMYKSYCDNFFKKLDEKKITNLTIYITIDKFHRNYFNNKENPILDNLLKYKEKYKLILYVQSTITKIASENLEFEFIEYYSKKGIKFILNPLLPWGRGTKLLEKIPYLNLKENDKTTLGYYDKYFYILGLSKHIWNNFLEYEKINNFEAIKKLNCCGKTITFMENKYYYCMPCSGKDTFEFSKLGELSYNNYQKFITNNKHICKMKNNEINIDDYDLNCPIGYGVCGLCRKMVEDEQTKIY